MQCSFQKISIFHFFIFLTFFFTYFCLLATGWCSCECITINAYINVYIMLPVDSCFYCINVCWANVYMEIFPFYGGTFARQSGFLMKRCSYDDIFPIVRERSIPLAYLLRNRKNRSDPSSSASVPPRLFASVPPSSSLKLGHTFRLCSQLSNALPWLLTGS